MGFMDSMVNHSYFRSRISNFGIRIEAKKNPACGRGPGLKFQSRYFALASKTGRKEVFIVCMVVLAGMVIMLL